MQMTSVVLAMVGKFCITGSYGIIYLMTVELFPTVVRCVVYLINALLAVVGLIHSPVV